MSSKCSNRFLGKEGSIQLYFLIQNLFPILNFRLFRSQLILCPLPLLFLSTLEQADEDNPRRGYADSDSSSEASSSLDGEGGPGAFVGGHTGHAAAQLQAAREAEARASEAVRVAQAERDRMQAQLDSLNRQRAQSSNANGNGEETMEGDRDLDADIEDLDD